MPLSSYAKLLSFQVSLCFLFDYKVSWVSCIYPKVTFRFRMRPDLEYWFFAILNMTPAPGSCRFCRIHWCHRRNCQQSLRASTHSRGNCVRKKCWSQQPHVAQVSYIDRATWLFMRKKVLNTNLKVYVSWIATIVGACTVALFMANLLTYISTKACWGTIIVCDVTLW